MQFQDVPKGFQAPRVKRPKKFIERVRKHSNY